MSPDTSAAALDVLLVMKEYGFSSNPGIDGGIEQVNIEFWFFSVFGLVTCALLPRLLLWLLK